MLDDNISNFSLSSGSSKELFLQAIILVIEDIYCGTIEAPMRCAIQLDGVVETGLLARPSYLTDQGKC